MCRVVHENINIGKGYVRPGIMQSSPTAAVSVFSHMILLTGFAADSTVTLFRYKKIHQARRQDFEAL